MKKYLKLLTFSLIPIISVIIYHYGYQYRESYEALSNPYYSFELALLCMYAYHALAGLLMGLYLKQDFDKKISMIINIIYIILFILVLLYGLGLFIIPYRLYTLFGYAQNLTAVWIGVFICKIIMILMGDFLKKINGTIMFIVSIVLPILTVIAYDRLRFLVSKFDYEALTMIDDMCVSYGIYIIFGIIIGLYLSTSYHNKKLQLIINIIYALFFIASKLNLYNIMIFPTFVYQLAYMSFEFVTLWIGVFICKIIFIVKDGLYEKSL
ncbi:MAG: hypothetical protein LUG12_01880 [Erysipelotrichaceae bacterium]|nr:hypothetical protein [Erysipelotrichaceae bacterium]